MLAVIPQLQLLGVEGNAREEEDGVGTTRGGSLSVGARGAGGPRITVTVLSILIVASVKWHL